MPDFGGDSGTSSGYVNPDSWVNWGGENNPLQSGGDNSGAESAGFTLDFDPSWLSGLGFDGQTQDSFALGGSSADGQGQRTSEELKNWLKANQYTPQSKAGSGQDFGQNLLRLVNGSGKQVGSTHSWSQNDDPGNLFGLAVMAAGGFAGGAGLAAAGASGAGSTAALNAGLSAGATYGSGGSTSDILKGAAASGLGSYAGGQVSGANFAGDAGLSGTTADIANKALGGAVSSGLKGGNPLTGGAISGAGAGANSMWDSFMGGFGGGSGSQLPETDSWNFGAGFDGGFNGGGVSQPAADFSNPDGGAPQSDYEKWRNANQGYSSPTGVAPTAMAPVMSSTPSLASSFAGQPQQKTQVASAGADPMAYAQGSDQGMGSIATPGGNATTTTGWQDYLKKNGGNLAGMLGSLYLGQRQASQAGRTRSMLDSLYSQGSPYALHMRDVITRQDAAAGRRSQVGPREVQLAAALTNARSGQLMSPGYQGLQGQEQGGYAQALGPLIAGYNRGTFNGIGDAASSGYQALSNYFNG